MSKRKSSVCGADDEKLDENEDVIYLIEQPDCLRGGKLK